MGNENSRTPGAQKGVVNDGNADIKRIRNLLKKRQKVKGEFLELLKELADKLHKQHRQLNIAKTTFASSGVAGGVVSIVGFSLAPVTLGASIIVSLVGGGIAVASGAGGLSAFLAEKVIIKKLWKKVEKGFEEQIKIELKIKELITKLGEGVGVGLGTYGFISKVVKLADKMGDVDTIIGGVGTAAKGIKTGATTAKTLTATLTTAGKVFHYGGFVFSLVGIGFDIYTIVQTSKKIHKDHPCEAEEQLRELIKKLECEEE